MTRQTLDELRKVCSFSLLPLGFFQFSSRSSRGEAFPS